MFAVGKFTTRNGSYTFPAKFENDNTEYTVVITEDVFKNLSDKHKKLALRLKQHLEADTTNSPVRIEFNCERINNELVFKGFYDR